MPKVSICIPNLNTRPYLPERFETIFNQTFQDWELIVYDSFSDDGAWEYIQEQAAKEPRMRIFQGPREKPPVCWNPCIREARGELVYIATSDDTMPPDCLQKLVAALDARTECDLAHCPLRVIGQGAEQMNEWWERKSPFALSSGEMARQPHVRQAPFDGLLHLCGDTVYISITQLLMRRSLFDRIGLFDGRWGSVGDFHWNMRAGLVANTVHVPDTWGGWRLHPAQATSSAGYGGREHRRKIEEMIDDALQQASEKLPPELRRQLAAGWRNHFRDRWYFLKRFDEMPTRRARAAFLIKEAASGSPLVWSYLAQRGKGFRAWSEPPGKVVAGWLEAVGIRNPIKAV